MSRPFYFQPLPPMLDALCAEIDRYPVRYNDAFTGDYERLGKPTLFTGIVGSVPHNRVVQYFGEVRIDNMPALEFVFRDGSASNWITYVNCFFGDADKSDGTSFLCKGDDAYDWPRLNIDCKYKIFGDYLQEQMTLALAFATGYATKPVSQRRLNGPGPS